MCRTVFESKMVFEGRSSEVQGHMLVMSKRPPLSVLWQIQSQSWAGSLVSRDYKSTLMHNSNKYTHRFVCKAENGLSPSAAVKANGFHRRRYAQVACRLHYAAASVPNCIISFFLISHLCRSWFHLCINYMQLFFHLFCLCSNFIKLYTAYYINIYVFIVLSMWYLYDACITFLYFIYYFSIMKHCRN